MPIYQSRADKARRLIKLHTDRPQAREAVEEANRELAHATARSSNPPEIVEAHRELVTEAEKEAANLQQEYDDLMREFAPK